MTTLFYLACSFVHCPVDSQNNLKKYDYQYDANGKVVMDNHPLMIMAEKKHKVWNRLHCSDTTWFYLFRTFCVILYASDWFVTSGKPSESTCSTGVSFCTLSSSSSWHPTSLWLPTQPWFRMQPSAPFLVIARESIKAYHHFALSCTYFSQIF